MGIVLAIQVFQELALLDVGIQGNQIEISVTATSHIQPVHIVQLHKEHVLTKYEYYYEKNIKKNKVHTTYINDGAYSFGKYQHSFCN